MTKNFQPKIILITGCSSGFGLLTAVHLAGKGHHVIATMRNLNKKTALFNEVQRIGAHVDCQELDVTRVQSINTITEYIKQKYGYVDVLVNNAGYGIGGFFEDLSDEEIRQQLETNFFGVQNVTRRIIPFMRSRRKGTIINISSIAGLSASPAFGAYNASKWALEGFSESLRYELQLFGIKVCMIEPGTYKTPIFFENARYAEKFNNSDSPYFTYSQMLKERVNDYVNDCFKDPNEIAYLVEKIIHKKNPALRNIPDIESKTMYFLRKFLPFRIYSAIISKALFSKKILIHTTTIKSEVQKGLKK